jgi:hypothetical protein
MADFRMKLITLAGVAAVFAGAANAQGLLSCTAASAVTSSFVRAESNADQVGDVQVTCTGGAAGSAAATVNLQVFMTPSVNITSASVGSGSSAKSETLAGITTDFANTQKNGSVSANSVTFSGIAVPALGANATTTITITNIKIQASSIGANTGVPTAVGESIFVSGTGVNNNTLTANNVAFVTNGLTGVKAAGPDNNNKDPHVNQICQTITGANMNFSIAFAENFATAMKVKGTATGNAALNDWFNKNTETGYGYTNGTDNTATSGTRVAVTFNNVPANVNVYVPLTINDTVNTDNTVNGKWQLVKSATGAEDDVTAVSTSGSNPPPSGAGQVSISNGTGTAVYEYVRSDGNTIEKYVLNVYLQAAAGSVAAPSGAITATVNYAPIGTSSNVPNFVSGSSTATVNGSTFIACSTTLLFPFVTNQLGFDTGLAISNTSKDLLASGGTKSAAANASGTCTLNFFGDTAPAAVTTASITSGTTYAAAASTLAPGFQGYMIASCNFLYGHGFAYVVYNLTQNNGAAMGYLADAITADRKSLSASGSVTGTIAAGAGTVTGTIGTTAVGSNTPEQ